MEPRLEPPASRFPARLLRLVLLAGLLALAAPAGADLPPEDRCPTVGGASVGDPAQDALPRRLEPGMRIHLDSLLSLRSLLPEEVWANRRVFFYPGMQMVIGPCHRRYPVPAFFREASERHAGSVRLDAEGNLRGYRAGLPFPPETIDLEAPDAGVRWAWNLALRFRGAGPVGSFRIIDIPGRVGGLLKYAGDFFFLVTRHRSDLAATDYTLPGEEQSLFVAGGRFREPSDARHLAWRQLRPPKSHERYETSDETFVYVPTMRKVRRSATPWVDGMFVPRFRVAGDMGGGGMAVGGTGYGGPDGSLHPSSALSAHQTEHLPRGFTLITLRPNAYVWRVHGEQEVLAPMASARPGYPIDRDRNYGPYGLSPANDRWDVRQAVVIEGRTRDANETFRTLTVYVDQQTQLPLYVVKRGDRRRILEVGIPVHRFSEDTLNYPGWASGERAAVFDPVAEFFYRIVDDSGWRRESYDVRSTPVEERLLHRFTSTDFLVRGR